MKLKNTILSLLRHVLTFGGGFVAAKNPHIIDAQGVETAVGLISAVLGAAWGARDEHSAENKGTRYTPADLE